MDRTPIPLADVAGRWLAALAEATGSPAVAALDGATLLGERAALMGFRIPGRISAGGACRLHAARDGEVALNLARADDRDMLPALFADGSFDPADDAGIATRITRCEAAALVARGREMGLAIAAVCPPTQPKAVDTEGVGGCWRDRSAGPRILDLSALWAGPLAAQLLWLAGGSVVKVESLARPDAMRHGQPAFYDLLNQGKASVALDVRTETGGSALLALIAGADIVIEAARPRGLLQRGIDADALVAARPGLTWITITAYGHTGEAADWIGFGDDVGIAAGLGAAMAAATGRAGFVGDAIADPLTGIAAATIAWHAWTQGCGGRHGVAMREVTARALAETQANDAAGLEAALVAWADAEGRPFPRVRARAAQPARPFGADPPEWPC